MISIDGGGPCGFGLAFLQPWHARSHGLNPGTLGAMGMQVQGTLHRCTQCHAVFRTQG